MSGNSPPEAATGFPGFGDGLAENGVPCSKALDHGVRKTGGGARSARFPDFAKGRQRVAGSRHSAGSGVMVAIAGGRSS